MAKKRFSEAHVRLLYNEEPKGRFRNIFHFRKYLRHRDMFLPCNVAFRLYFKSVAAKGKDSGQ